MTDWHEQAKCRIRPDLWFDGARRSLAMHICRAHCPVVETCLHDALATPPKEGVQGGVAFNNDRKPFPDTYCIPARTCPSCHASAPKDPPTDTGVCGTYAGYRRHLRRFQHACEPCKAGAARRQRRGRVLDKEGEE